MSQQLQTVQRVTKGLAQMEKQFKSTLPAHIDTKKFLRAAVTAVQNTPDLQAADYESIIASCQKAATDGLIIDNREAALVVFNANIGTKDRPQWVKKAQYIPMIAGLLKKARQSGQISKIYAHAVYDKDHFEYFIDESGEHIKHIPTLTGDRGAFLLAYAGAMMKDGSTQVKVMPKEDIERARKASKAGSDDQGNPKGIWKTWYPEMACKTALRKLCGILPSSTDLDQVWEHDNEQYHDDEPETPATPDQPVQPPAAANDKLKQRAAAKQKERGEVIDGESQRVEEPDGRPTPPPITDEEMPI